MILRDKLRLVIAEETVGTGRVSEITGETSIIDDLGADSLTVTEIMMRVEDLVNLEISDEDAKPLVVISSLEKYLAGRGVELDREVK